MSLFILIIVTSLRCALHEPSRGFSCVRLWVSSCFELSAQPRASPEEFSASSFLCRPCFYCGCLKAFAYLLLRSLRICFVPAYLHFTPIVFPCFSRYVVLCVPLYATRCVSPCMVSWWGFSHVPCTLSVAGPVL